MAFWENPTLVCTAVDIGLLKRAKSPFSTLVTLSWLSLWIQFLVSGYIHSVKAVA